MFPTPLLVRALLTNENLAAWRFREYKYTNTAYQYVYVKELGKTSQILDDFRNL